MVIHVPRRVCTLFGLAPSPSVVAVSSAASALAEDLPHRVLAVVTVGGSYADDHACAGAEMDDICAAQAGAGLAAQIDYVDDKPYGRAFPNFGEDDLKFANIAKCCLRVVTAAAAAGARTGSAD
jgi:hypothetical protein